MDSQVGKPTYATCAKGNYEERFGCGIYEHKVRDSLTRDGNQVSPNALKGDAPKKIVSLHSGLDNQRRMRVIMMMVSSYIYLFSVMSSF